MLQDQETDRTGAAAEPVRAPDPAPADLPFGPLDGHPGAALVMDGDGRVLDANPKGRLVAGLLESGDGPALIQAARRAIEMGGPRALSLVLEGPDGPLYMEASVIPSPVLAPAPVSDGSAPPNSALVIGRDVTLERNLRATLVESRERYKDLVEASSDFYWETDAEGRFVFVTSRGVLGHGADALVGVPAQTLLADVGPDMEDPFLYPMPQLEREVQLCRSDGQTAVVLLSSRPITDETGEIIGARGVCRDVTDDRLREAALDEVRRREHLLNFIASAIRDELAPEDMLKAAAEATVRALEVLGGRVYRLQARPRVCVLEDGEPEAVAGPADTVPALMCQAQSGDAEGADAALAAIIADLEARMVAPAAAEDGMTDPVGPGDPGSPGSHLSGDLIRHQAGGRSFLLAPTLHRRRANGVFVLWQDGEETPWADDHLLLLRDVANQVAIAIEQLLTMERVVALSRTDALTGLLNRRAFFDDELPRRLDRLKRDGHCGALFYVDMDNFKLVNDVHGHARGDEAILALRDILLDFSRPGDLAARLGGDEFALWLDTVSTRTANERAADLIEASARLADFSGDPDRRLGLSIGVSLFDPSGDQDLASVIDRADAAMYAVKRAGKGGYFMSDDDQPD